MSEGCDIRTFVLYILTRLARYLVGSCATVSQRSTFRRFRRKTFDPIPRRDRVTWLRSSYPRGWVSAAKARKRNGRRRRCSRLHSPVIRLGTPNPYCRASGTVADHLKVDASNTLLPLKGERTRNFASWKKPGTQRRSTKS